MQSLNDLALMVCEKKPTLHIFFKWENMSSISLEHVRNSKLVIYSCSIWRNHQLYKVSTYLDKNIKFSVKTVKTLLWPWNTTMVTESGMNGLSSTCTTIMQNLTIIFMKCPWKWQHLSFCHIRTTGLLASLTLIITYTYFHVNQKSFLKAKL